MSATKGEREGKHTSQNNYHSSYKRCSDVARLPQSRALNHTQASVQYQSSELRLDACHHEIPLDWGSTRRWEESTQTPHIGSMLHFN